MRTEIKRLMNVNVQFMSDQTHKVYKQLTRVSRVFIYNLLATFSSCVY